MRAVYHYSVVKHGPRMSWYFRAYHADRFICSDGPFKSKAIAAARARHYLGVIAAKIAKASK